MPTLLRSLSFLLLSCAATASAAPVTLSHSGYLLGANDAALESSGTTMRFEIFTSATPAVDALPAWSSGDCLVAVHAGYYAVALGQGCGAGLDTTHLPTTPPNHLRVSVAGVTLSPLVSLYPGPTTSYADDAGKVGGLALSGLVQKTETTLPLVPGGTANATTFLRGDGAWAPAVTSVGVGAAPLSVTGGVTPTLSIAQAGAGADGFLSATDWGRFDAKVQVGGDLGGTATAPVVTRVQGRDVSASAPTTGQVLRWNGSTWEPGSPTAAEATGSLGYTPVNQAGDTMTGNFAAPRIAVNNTTSGYQLVTGAQSGVATPLLMAAINGVSNGFTVATDAANNLTYSFLTGTGAQGLYQAPSGSVGIGTAAPTAQLTFGKTAATTETNLPTIAFANEIAPGVGNDLKIAANSTSGGILLATGPSATTQVAVTAAGSVGIGTTAPTAKLDVRGSLSVSSSVNFDQPAGGVGATQMLATSVCIARSGYTAMGWIAAYQRGSYATCNARCAATGSIYYVNCRGMFSVRGYMENGGANPADWGCANTGYANYTEFYCCCSY